MRIHYSDSLAGSGKTWGLQRKAAWLIHNSEYVFLLQPTKELLDRTAEEFRREEPGVHATVIHEDVVTGGVVKAVMKHLADPFPEPHLLMATWSAFERLPYFENRSRWHLLVDEAPQVHQRFSLKVPRTHTMVTDCIDTYPCGATYSQILVADRSRLRKLSECSSKDDAAKVFTPVVKTLLSPHWQSYAVEHRYRGLLCRENETFEAFSVLQPSIFNGFASVTVAGARFQETPLYLLWNDKVRFERDTEVERNLRYRTHSGGDRLSILYAFEENWSKNLRDKDDGRAWKLFIDGVRGKFGSQPFLYMANKDFDPSLFGPEAVRLPNTPHGLNEYQQYENVVVLSSLNPTTTHFNFLDWKALCSEDVRNATYHHSIYQAVMRGALRDPNNYSDKMIIVPDRSAAEWLQPIFPGSQVEPLGIDLGGIPLKGRPGRRKTHCDDSERKRLHREKKKAELLAELDNLSRYPNPALKPLEDACANGSVQTRCDENPFKVIAPNFVPRFHGSVWDRVTAEAPSSLIADWTIDQFVDLLKRLHKRTVPSKEANKLLSPACFGPSDGYRVSRRRDNAVFANGIWLDFENGDLTHKEFANLFPTLRIVAFNTWSSTKAAPRWRAYLPVSDPITSNHYHAITKQIVQFVRSQGYRLDKRDSTKPHLKAHGIDLTKLHASDMFYLPSRANDESGTFWKDHKSDRRGPIPVEDWIRHSILPSELAPSQRKPSTTLTQEIMAHREQCLEWFRCNGVKPGTGDHAISILCMQLR